jgi:hypothetical protein
LLLLASQALMGLKTQNQFQTSSKVTFSNFPLALTWKHTKNSIPGSLFSWFETKQNFVYLQEEASRKLEKVLLCSSSKPLLCFRYQASVSKPSKTRRRSWLTVSHPPLSRDQ